MGEYDDEIDAVYRNAGVVTSRMYVGWGRVRFVYQKVLRKASPEAVRGPPLACQPAAGVRRPHLD